MPIPSYQELMLPVLKVLSENPPMRTGECAELVAHSLNISEDEVAEMLPSGRQRYIVNRTGWAAWYMMQAGLVDRPKRGIITATEEGKRLIRTNPPIIDNKLLRTYPAFVERIDRSAVRSAVAENEPTDSEERTPSEQIEAAVQKLHLTLISDLRDQLANVNPYRFEIIVVDLLVAMGYGNSRQEAARVTRRSGDGGIDGVIEADRLGLDSIYIQAKRWQSPVGEPELRDFVGALDIHRAQKGVFITTSTFSEAARRYVDRASKKISLIDGQRLAELMIDSGVGVSKAEVYEIKKVDSDYFEET